MENDVYELCRSYISVPIRYCPTWCSINRHFESVLAFCGLSASPVGGCVHEMCLNVEVSDICFVSSLAPIRIALKLTMRDKLHISSLQELVNGIIGHERTWTVVERQKVFEERLLR
jgi:hypothetical protein